jgi:hypothetical protein
MPWPKNPVKQRYDLTHFAFLCYFGPRVLETGF